MASLRCHLSCLLAGVDAAIVERIFRAGADSLLSLHLSPFTIQYSARMRRTLEKSGRITCVLDIIVYCSTV